MKGNGRALVVERELGIRQLLGHLFSEHQFVTLGVTSIKGMLPVLDQEEFELILVNWSRAWEPYRALLKGICAAHPESVVVVSNLGGDLALAIDLLKAGARECLTVAATPSDLVQASNLAILRHFRAVLPWYDHSVMAIASAIGLRDVETEEHCQRVANTTVRLCTVLGITQEKRLHSIRWGAFLHDVGKVAIRDGILHKSGPLTAEENRQMRRHPEIGRELLTRIPFLGDSIPLVLHHHERYDGGGYPDGMRGEDIPLEARAIAVADTVDAMVNTRPYRRALSWDQAVMELREHRGTQFDPWVVDQALRYQHEVFEDYFPDAERREGRLC